MHGRDGHGTSAQCYTGEVVSNPSTIMSRGQPVPRRARILKSQTIYRGRVIQLKVEEVVEPGGVETRREVVYHPGSVVIIPYLPDGRIILVRQYRHAVRQSLWELVAGGMEPGETARQAAHRELMEETGYQARVVKPLIEFYPSPGIVSEKMHLFEAHGLTPAKGQPDADERIEIGTFTTSELMAMVGKNEIQDAKTLVGLLWVEDARKRSSGLRLK
jgi:ADP-ribose pyrophosphatase